MAVVEPLPDPGVEGVVFGAGQGGEVLTDSVVILSHGSHPGCDAAPTVQRLASTACPDRRPGDGRPPRDFRSLSDMTFSESRCPPNGGILSWSDVALRTAR